MACQMAAEPRIATGIGQQGGHVPGGSFPEPLAMGRRSAPLATEIGLQGGSAFEGPDRVVRMGAGGGARPRGRAATSGCEPRQQVSIGIGTPITPVSKISTLLGLSRGVLAATAAVARQAVRSGLAPRPVQALPDRSW